MSLRRVVSILGVSLVATGSLVSAAPDAKAGAKKKAPAPVAPAKDAPAGAGSAAPAATGDAAGSAVAPIEDAPPSDMNGTDENPDAPHALTNADEHKVEATVPTTDKKRDRYPVEEARRPITLPENMSEVSIAPHAQVSPAAGGDALRARYGITKQIQLGLTYAYVGIYDRKMVDPGLSKSYGFHSGKAFGIDVTVLLQNWLGVKVGVPFYADPVAASLQIAAPIKFSFGDKFAIGGLDDLLNIKLAKFAPSFYQEVNNAASAQLYTTNTELSRGHLRFSGFAVYQLAPQTAFIGRVGVDNDLGLASGSGGFGGSQSGGGTTTFIRAGIQQTVRSFFDLGISLGFDDLAVAGSFAPSGYLALRI
jgi:hypothetical protein